MYDPGLEVSDGSCRISQSRCFVETLVEFTFGATERIREFRQALSTKQHEEQQEQDAQFKGAQSADHGASSTYPGAPRC